MMRLRLSYSIESMQILNVLGIILGYLGPSTSSSLVFGKLISMVGLRFTYSKEFM
jgi:hypothetical protein